MKILCLTDFPMGDSYRWLWDHLPPTTDQVHFLARQAPDRSAGWGKLFTRYPAYLRLGVEAAWTLAHAPYDLVIAWEAKVGIPYALVRRALDQRKPPFILLAFNPGDVPPLLQPAIAAGLKVVDHLTVVATVEKGHYQQRYGLSPEQITVSPLATYDLLPPLENKQAAAGPRYIHASGRSARDYETLIRAVSGLDVQVLIHGCDYNIPHLPIPANVEVGGMVPRDEYLQLVQGALLEVVPLLARRRPAGSSQVVLAMMMGKAVIATRTESLVDYVEDGVTGLLVAPADVAAMREAIVYLLDHPEEAVEMGRRARRRYEAAHTYEQFATRTYRLLQQLYREERSE